MMLEIVTLVLGPADTNTYLIADGENGDAAVIDPAWDGEVILGEAKERSWKIGQIWYTHGHFDHFGGAAAISAGLDPRPVVGLHPDDHDLWKTGGGGELFGFQIKTGPEASIDLSREQTLWLGGLRFDVRHTPGHTPGHCILYCATAGVLFSGDLIFQGGVGRTDLPGGDWDALVKSIRELVYNLPESTRILPGHGPGTTVGREKKSNPFVTGDEFHVRL
jgi:glyoxylase-like metal-dependent hydrolase (beta-lactamase superfamily II)